MVEGLLEHTTLKPQEGSDSALSIYLEGKKTPSSYRFLNFVISILLASGFSVLTTERMTPFLRALSYLNGSRLV